MTRPIPRIIRFHEGAGEGFRTAILDAYEQLSPAIRSRLESFAGARTFISTVDRPFLPPTAISSGDWLGRYMSPDELRTYSRYLPLADRAFTRFARPSVFLTEHNLSGQPISLSTIASTIMHELGHRIDAAISGHNILPERPGSQGSTFSLSPAFLDAVRQDLLEAERTGRLDSIPPRYRARLMTSGSLASLNPREFASIAQEVFADVFADRFSRAMIDQSSWPAQLRGDLSLFRNAGLLVDRAVASFTGQSLMPREPYASRDYPSGNGPTPLVSGSGLPVVTDETPHTTDLTPRHRRINLNASIPYSSPYLVTASTTRMTDGGGQLSVRYSDTITMGINSQGEILSDPTFRTPADRRTFYEHVIQILNNPSFTAGEARITGFDEAARQRMLTSVQAALTREQEATPSLLVPGR